MLYLALYLLYITLGRLKEGAQRSVNAQERVPKKPTTTLPIEQSFMQRQLSIISSTDIIKSARKVLEKKCDLELKSGIANRSGGW